MRRKTEEVDVKHAAKHGKYSRIWFAAVISGVLLVAASTATYAWFTSNRQASANQATARTGSQDVRLYLSSVGGTGFQNQSEAAISQVNGTDLMSLLPVSTANLQSFVRSLETNENDDADTFREVTDESGYYHGRIYMRAEAAGMDSNTRVAVYLDQTEEAGGSLVTNGDGNLLRSARLGLVINENVDSPYIFSLDQTTTGTTNTIVGGATLENGQVLQIQDGVIRPADDPSVPLENETIRTSGTSMVVPEQPLLILNLNEINQIDVYFYLEGCDPDCQNKITQRDMTLHLSFYGMLME